MFKVLSLNIIVASQDDITVGIIPGSFLGIRQNGIGRLYFGEQLGRLFDVPIIPVGMEFEGFLFVSFLDPIRPLAYDSHVLMHQPILFVRC